ncbi:MAG: flagellar motor switch protein FliG [Candidatus Latescibacterota bacterium]|nr:MAG: flagellar motor switch protein FliG [Candidatus Latescibacterota bacterium]
MSAKQFSSSRKAAIVLVALGRDVASEVLKHLDEDEIETLTREIANLRDVSPEDKEEVLTEFFNDLTAGELYAHGGFDYAREVLTQAMGGSRAEDILHRLYTSPKDSGLVKLRNLDSYTLAELIKDEHPQTICLILSQLQTAQAAAILASLSPELQGEVALRMATMEKISPHVVKNVQNALQSQIETTFNSELSATGGTKVVAEILNQADRATEKQVLKQLEEKNPDIAAEIKDLMFVFEDILILDDLSVQKVMREVDVKQLSLALKAAGDDVKRKILSNVSERVAQMVQEEIEFMGPVRLKDVEEAQHQIVEIIRRLEDAGEIVITRGGEEIIV